MSLVAAVSEFFETIITNTFYVIIKNRLLISKKFMKKLFLISLLSGLMLALPSAILAQVNRQGEVEAVPQAAQQGIQDQDRIQDPNSAQNIDPMPEGNQVQNQASTQNAGEESQLQNQETLYADEDSGSSVERNAVARERMSIVAREVEKLLADGEQFNGTLGEQVKQIAQQQKQAQKEINDELENLEARQGLMRSLFGADQKAVKNMKQQLEENQRRIEVMSQLQNEVSNQAEETQIQNVINAMISQNSTLQEQIRAEEQVGGVFGWLRGLLSL